MHQEIFIPEEIGKQIRKARKTSGISGTELAQIVFGKGTNQSVISRLETGELTHRLEPSVVEKIFHILDLSEDLLIEAKATYGIAIPSWDVLEAQYKLAKEASRKGRYGESIKLLSAIRANLNQYFSDAGWDAHSGRLAAKVYDLWGNVLRIRNQQDLAVNVFREAHYHAERLGDLAQEAEILLGLGVTHRVRGENTEGARYLSRVLEVLECVHEDREWKERKKIDAQNHLVLIYADMGKESLAANLYRSTKTTLAKHLNQQPFEWAAWMEAQTHKYYGRTLLHLRHYSEAEAHLLDCIDLSECSWDDRFDLDYVSAQISLCDLYLRQKKTDKALQCKYVAQEVCSRYGFHHQQEKLKRILHHHNDLLGPNEVQID